MSALARWFLAQKWAISGSDITFSPLLQELKKEGVKVKIGHKKANITSKIALVVYNQAIPASNPELKEAWRRGIPTLTYPEALGHLSRFYKTIAIAGAHGKSTITALLSLILVKAGFDPTVILGTLLKEFGNKNFRAGKSDYLVIEADEWKASFLNYSPLYAILTNIDKEHLDFYKNFSNVKKTFLKFINNIGTSPIRRGSTSSILTLTLKEGESRKIENNPNSVLVANRDDKNLWALKSKIQKIAKRNNCQVIWYSTTTAMRPHSCRVAPHRSLVSKIKKVLKIPGHHNVSNALAAYTLARALGVKEKIILQALGQYRGAWRRMEFRGKLEIGNSKLEIFDDYAHHPTEIKVTFQAFKEKFPRRKIICVFQPHQAHRTKNLFKEFISAFDLADYLILLPIYQVAGRDKPHKGYTSADLAKKIEIRNSKLGIRNSVFYLPSPKKLPVVIRSLVTTCHLPVVIVMMGAGDIVNYTDLLLK